MAGGSNANNPTIKKLKAEAKEEPLDNQPAEVKKRKLHGGRAGQEDAGMQHRRAGLTRPKQPELRTAYRVRAPVKSTAELEEEKMAKIPRFKARPFKIAQGPPIPPLRIKEGQNTSKRPREDINESSQIIKEGENTSKRPREEINESSQMIKEGANTSKRLRQEINESSEKTEEETAPKKKTSVLKPPFLLTECRSDVRKSRDKFWEDRIMWRTRLQLDDHVDLPRASGTGVVGSSRDGVRGEEPVEGTDTDGEEPADGRVEVEGDV